ncbi:MAG: hypothetical protein ACRBCK_05735 [Alphaproteobacteria bacterium]
MIFNTRHLLMLTALGAGVAFMHAPTLVSAQEGEAVSAEDFIRSGKGDAKSAPKQEEVKEKTPIEKSIDEAKAELEDKELAEKKIELARIMHKVRPTRDQVDGAIKRASLALPATERQAFVGAMQSMLNYNAIERISMDAMVQTYTFKELKSMVDYFSKPEAKSASDKTGHWARAVQPEIARMIDRAMMRVRTGIE